MLFKLNQPLPVGYFLPWGWPIVLAGSSMENLSMPLLESLETKVWSTFLSAFSFSMVYVRIINQFKKIMPSKLISAMIMSQVFSGIAGQMVCASIFGFTFGGYVTSTIIILKKIFEDLDSALGLVLFSCAVASIIGPVIVGRKESSS